MRLIPIRRLLAISLVLLATVPALLVAWVLGRAAGDSVDALAGDLLGRVAALVQAGTEGELRRAHDVLNGVFPERLNPAQAERARRWLREPQRFEATAFALTLQSPEVPVLRFANARGDYFGLEATPEGARVALHAAGNGTEIRATAEGPGVAPDVMWQGPAPGAYDQTADATANRALAALGDPHCRPN